MRRIPPLLFALSALAASGCGGRAATKPAASGASGAAAVEARSESAHGALDAESGAAPAAAAGAGRALAAPTGTLAPEPAGPQAGDVDVRRGKVLGTDPDGCTWLEGEASVVVSGDMSLNQARAAAQEQARAAAVQDFLGVDVNSKFMDFQQEGLKHDAHLTESILQTTRNGRIIKEKIAGEGYRDIPASADGPACRSCRYSMTLQACVLPRDASDDKDFRVELQLSQARFFSGDEAKISITATRDCSVYLYDVYDLAADNKTALVVPNEVVPAKTLKAGETWEYPDDDAKARGVRLVAELPNAGDAVSAETIVVVATRTPLSSAVYDPTDGGYLGVFRRLHHSRTEWAEDAEAYTIYKK
jgi:hypothetical protein